MEAVDIGAPARKRQRGLQSVMTQEEITHIRLNEMF